MAGVSVAVGLAAFILYCIFGIGFVPDDVKKGANSGDGAAQQDDTIHVAKDGNPCDIEDNVL